ncbi:ribosome recycling factor, partial [Lactiplantibacillus plantarum]
MMTITDYTADLERKKDLVAVTKSFLYGVSVN